jgi:type I restriction enzyme S subunit
MGSAGANGMHDSAIAPGPGVVLGRSGASFGQAHYVEVDYWPHNTALYVTDFHGNSPRYVYNLLRYIDFSRYNSGGAQQSLNRNFIAGIILPIPDPVEQGQITEAIDDAERLIAMLVALIAKKRDIKQGIMQELLTGKTRLAGFAGDWRDVRLGDVLTVRHGRSQKAVEDPTGVYPILASGGQIGWSRTALYMKPSVLIGRKGTIDRPQFQDRPFWTVDTLFYTEVSPSADPRFIYYVFLTIDWRSMNEASGVPSLSSSRVESAEVRVPELEEQRAIRAVLDDADAEIDALKRRLDSARAIKTGMMQELLTGQTRLPVEAAS